MAQRLKFFLLNSERGLWYTTTGAANSKISNQPVLFESNRIGIVRRIESRSFACRLQTAAVSGVSVAVVVVVVVVVQ